MRKANRRTFGMRWLAAALALILMAAPIHRAGAEGVISNSVSLKVHQKHRVDDGEGHSGERIRFRLVPRHPKNPMPKGSGEYYEFQIVGTDEHAIAPIEFPDAGEFEYDVEYIDQNLDYGCEIESFTVRVIVEEGESPVVLLYNEAGAKVSSMTFSHESPSSEPTPTDPESMFDPPIVKTVVGSPATDAAFEFVMIAGAASANAPAVAAIGGGERNVRIVGPGQASFGQWSYSEPGVYHYTAFERDGGLRGYRYDREIYTITDTVTEEGGELFVSRVVTNSAKKPVRALAFVNEYDAPSGAEGPKTGDDSDADALRLLLALACAGAAASAILLARTRRRRAGASE